MGQNLVPQEVDGWYQEWTKPCCFPSLWFWPMAPTAHTDLDAQMNPKDDLAGASCIGTFKASSQNVHFCAVTSAPAQGDVENLGQLHRSVEPHWFCWFSLDWCFRKLFFRNHYCGFNLVTKAFLFIVMKVNLPFIQVWDTLGVIKDHTSPQVMPILVVESHMNTSETNHLHIVGPASHDCWFKS